MVAMKLCLMAIVIGQNIATAKPFAGENAIEGRQGSQSAPPDSTTPTDLPKPSGDPPAPAPATETSTTNTPAPPAPTETPTSNTPISSPDTGNPVTTTNTPAANAPTTPGTTTTAPSPATDASQTSTSTTSPSDTASTAASDGVSTNTGSTKSGASVSHSISFTMSRPADATPTVAGDIKTQNLLEKAIYIRYTINAFYKAVSDHLNKTSSGNSLTFAHAYQNSLGVVNITANLMQKAGKPLWAPCDSLDNIFNFRNVDESAIWRRGLEVTGVAISSHLDLLDQATTLNSNLTLELGSAMAIDTQYNDLFRDLLDIGLTDPNTPEARLPTAWAVAWAKHQLPSTSNCPLPTQMDPVAPILSYDADPPKATIRTGTQIKLSWKGPLDPDVIYHHVVWLNQLYTATYSSMSHPETDLESGVTNATTIIPQGLKGVAFAAVLKGNQSLGIDDLAAGEVEMLAGPAVIQIT